MLKQFDDVFFSQQPFHANVRKMLAFDLSNVSQLIEKQFYLEKLYEFLFEGIQRQHSNEVLY